MIDDDVFLPPQVVQRWLSRLIWVHLFFALGMECMLLAALWEIQLPVCCASVLTILGIAQFVCPLAVLCVLFLAFGPPDSSLACALLAEFLIITTVVASFSFFWWIPEEWITVFSGTLAMRFGS